MSVLHRRIMAQGVTAAVRPYGTEATPMVMPMHTIDYANNSALYGTVMPLVTADGAVIPAQSQTHVTMPWVAPVIPAGRP